MSGTIHDPGPGCRFVLAADSIEKPAKWAARMNLGLREWCWIAGGSGELRVYRLDTEATKAAAFLRRAHAKVAARASRRRRLAGASRDTSLSWIPAFRKRVVSVPELNP